jgi:hypothetical protein
VVVGLKFQLDRFPAVARRVHRERAVVFLIF